MNQQSQADIIIDAIHTALVRIDIWNAARPQLQRSVANYIEEMSAGPSNGLDDLVVNVFKVIDRHLREKPDLWQRSSPVPWLDEATMVGPALTATDLRGLPVIEDCAPGLPSLFYCQDCGWAGLEEDTVPSDGNPATTVCPQCSRTNVFACPE